MTIATAKPMTIGIACLRLLGHDLRLGWPARSAPAPVAGGRNSVVSSGASRAALRPSRLHASAKRLRMSSA